MNEPRVIYENKEFLAIDKPAGLMVHAAKLAAGRARKESEPTVVDWLREHYPKVAGVGDEPELRPGIVHRLDKDTSGVMLIAKNQEYFLYLKSLFQTHQIKKIYYAMVVGAPRYKEGTIDVPIGIRTGTLRRSVRSTKMAKEAVTAYRMLRSSGKGGEFSLLEVMPKTGRTHQIRVHLASIGHPIVGDMLYGRKKAPSPYARMMLHASSIEFPTKTGATMKIEAELPQEFR